MRVRGAAAAQQIASHGLFDVTVHAEGDLHIDDHHTNEDIALAFGQALAQALGSRAGIHRFGDFTAPLDEALVHVVLVRAALFAFACAPACGVCAAHTRRAAQDLSGRPHLSFDAECPTERVGTYDTQLVRPPQLRACAPAAAS